MGYVKSFKKETTSHTLFPLHLSAVFYQIVLYGIPVNMLTAAASGYLQPIPQLFQQFKLQPHLSVLHPRIKQCLIIIFIEQLLQSLF